MLSEKEKIALITQISLDINEVNDIDILLERILTNVRLFFNADAGSIYLKEGENLKFSHTQNNTLQKRLSPGQKLAYNTFYVPINNSSIAGAVAKNCQTINIANVYEQSGSEPYTFDSTFDKLSNYKTCSMLTVPISNQRNDVIGVMQIINSMDREGNIIPFLGSDNVLIKHFATSAGLAIERAQMTRNIIERMVKMAELRYPKETGSHINRVASYSLEIYEAWAIKRGLPSREIDSQRDILRMAAMLHDVGKVAISDTILHKPARLTLEEFEIMKEHTFLGARLFKDKSSSFDDMAAEVSLSHHEKWDGSGYPGYIDVQTGRPLKGFEDPKGKALPKKGEEISPFGRIVAVADVYDALSSFRSYKESWDEGRVLDEMYNCSGSHFDPEVIEAFFSRLEIIKTIADRYPGEPA